MMENKRQERFWKKVNKTDNCWEWQAAKTYCGYGIFCIDTKGTRQVAHRYSYELVNGKVPDGLELDHLCRNHSCVNPDHLEAVTRRENTIRGNVSKRKKSGLPVGVTKQDERYVATRYMNGWQYAIGSFKTPEDAKIAYETAIVKE